MRMSKQEKLFFLLDKIDDARKITPSGEYVKLHPIADLGLTSQIEFNEVGSILDKLDKDEKVIRIIKKSTYYLLDPSTNMSDYYILEVLERFQNYLVKIHLTPPYKRFVNINTNLIVPVKLTKRELRKMVSELIETHTFGKTEKEFLRALSDFKPKEMMKLAKEIDTKDIKHLKGAVSKKIRGTDFQIKGTRGGGYKKSTYQLEYLPFSKSQ